MWSDKQDTENEVFLSYTLTANGRGFGGFPEYYTALAPFPKTDAKQILCFFTLLHEITHQFTDGLIKGGISMQDGSHDLSENIVMLTDYYLIEALNPTILNDYFKWIQAISHNNNPLNAEIFMGIFSVGDQVKAAILEIVSKICI